MGKVEEMNMKDLTLVELSYANIAKVVGLKGESVRSAASKCEFDPSDLRSVMLYIMRRTLPALDADAFAHEAKNLMRDYFGMRTHAACEILDRMAFDAKESKDNATLTCLPRTAKEVLDLHDARNNATLRSEVVSHVCEGSPCRLCLW